MKVGRIAGSIVVLLSLACTVRGGPDVDAQVANLTSEDPKAAEEARRNLEAKGADVVPVLFDKLLVADWNLRPRLLEVLSKHGREFAKQKLKNGSETEKIYAALVYELSVACAGEEHDYDSPEFKAMVEALLRALKGEDKYLRAAAGLALVYDDGSTVFFEHFHEIIPALISSFDTDLVIDRHERGGPAEVVFIAIAEKLDAFIGDRLAYGDFESGPRDDSVRLHGDSGAELQRSMSKIIAAYRPRLDQLKHYWQTWWDEHSKMTPRELGTVIIERNLKLLEQTAPPRGDEVWMGAKWSLRLWAGTSVYPRDWATWWGTKKPTYAGPKRMSD